MSISQFKIELYKVFEAVVGKTKIRNIYLKKCVKRYKNANCIFIHIPKSGGTTIAHAVLGQRAGHFTALEVKQTLGNTIYENMYSFTVSRHPYDRLFSAYNYVKNKGGTDGGVRWEKSFEDPAFNSFDTFVKDWLIHQEIATVNILFKPQYMFVCDDNDNLLINHVAKLEELGALKEHLSIHLHREFEFITKNQTNTVDSKIEINEDIKALIYKTYEKDFTLFNYHP